MSTAHELISTERERQVSEEGWTAEHDAGHVVELGKAAWCYWHRGNLPEPVGVWPWDDKYWKPKDRVSNLIRAGALYQAAADASTGATERTSYLLRVADVARELGRVLQSVDSEGGDRG